MSDFVKTYTLGFKNHFLGEISPKKSNNLIRVRLILSAYPCISSPLPPGERIKRTFFSNVNNALYIFLLEAEEHFTSFLFILFSKRMVFLRAFQALMIILFFYIIISFIVPGWRFFLWSLFWLYRYDNIYLNFLM